MKLSGYLAPARVAVLGARDKSEALEKVLDLLRESSSIADFERFAAAVREREEVLATGIGLGLGVPHVRCPSVRDPVAALAVLREGVEYGSLDGVPVRLIVLIAMPANTHEEYLKYLSRLSNRFMNRAFRESILACDNAGALWELIKDQ